jgi:formate dehydrogenase major subunit
VWWNGKAWGGTDVPDFKADSPGSGDEPVHHEPRGRGAVLRRRQDGRGPFPEHYEPFETPIGINPLHPEPKATSNPAARVFNSTGTFGTPGVPVRGHHLPADRALPLLDQARRLNAITQPEQFVEIGEVLAKRRHQGRRPGAGVEQARHIEAVAVVTKRIRPLQVNGQTVHQIGIPLHWGFTGSTRTAT